MVKYLSRKKQTYPFIVSTPQGKSISFEDNLEDAKKEAFLYTKKTGRVAEIFRYIGRTES